MRKADVFPPASVLLSRAWWRLADRPAPVLLLGLGGSAPFAALLLLFLKEAEAGSLTGEHGAAPMGLAFAVAGAYLLRYPFRLALARWTVLDTEGRASLPAALGFAFVHLPTAVFYGALSTLGFLGGLTIAIPFQGCFLATFALNRFASSREESAWTALKASTRPPLWSIGLRLLSVAATLWLCLFLLFWMAPGTLLALAEWLLKTDTAALASLFGSFSWAAAAGVLALTAVELLWSLAYGLLAEEWRALSEGADLAATLRRLQAEREAA